MLLVAAADEEKWECGVMMDGSIVLFGLTGGKEVSMQCFSGNAKYLITCFAP